MKHQPLVIRHVKFRKAHDANLIYPAADTDQFEDLLKLPRGTLVFLPEKEDYETTREEAQAHLLAAAPELLEALKNLHEAFFSSADSDHGNAMMGAEAAIAKAEGK